MSADIVEFPAPSAPQTSNQLGILVLDGSGSMADKDREKACTKAEAVGNAASELLVRLRQSSRRQDFWLGLIAFDNNVDPRLTPTRVTDVNVATLNTNPLMGGQTAIGHALVAAEVMAEGFLSGHTDLPSSVVMMLMSDGCNNSGRDPLSVAREIKEKHGQKVNIVCVAYGKDADKETLSEICTDRDRGFLETDNAQKLRDFFLASIVERARPA